jgi:prevent-host-death family protein
MQITITHEFLNHCNLLLTRVEAGDEIVITRHGMPVARLIPERSAEPNKVNWADSPALTRDRTGARMLTNEEALDLIHEAAGKW